jgi:hypothetical protein
VDESEMRQLRDEMLALYALPAADDLWESLTTGLVNHQRGGRSGADLRRVFLHGLAEAETRWVPAKTVKLAEARAFAAPAVEIDREDVPFKAGLLLFEEPVTAIRVSDADGSRETRMAMSGLLWTEIRSTRQGASGIGAYALMDDIRMPTVALFLLYGERLGPAGQQQAVFFKTLQALWLLVR